MITVENLTKVYDSAKIVDSISFRVKKGDIFGFLGPNGAGKTTTINMMIGLVEPSAGTCLINGMSVNRRPLDVKKIIGYLPDRIGFYPNLSARQNLEYIARFYPGARVKDDRIKEILTYVGLGNVEKPAGSFSKGMAQRLGIAQLMVNDPRILFMDEPTNGLDPEGVVLLRDFIRDRAKEGKTIFLSSHNLGEIQSVCNRIGIISRGKIIATGTQDEVKDALQRNDHLEITVKAHGPLPPISSPHIIDATYNDGSAILHVRQDIRDEIARQLVLGGTRLLELGIRERSLEDVFLDTVYRSN